jgi:hypothetical protein
MQESEIKAVQIRAFRSIDDPESCDKYIEGHLKVLENIGVKKVTSVNNDWKYNPSSYTIIVESLDNQKVYGGARLQVADGIVPLPLELATGYLDNRVYDIVERLRTQGTSELCGLWNSMEIAGLGIGAFFMTKAGVVIAEQLNIKTIFALCAPITVRFANKVGCILCKEVGNNGTFYYPKLDLIATVVLLNDTFTLLDADPEVRESVFFLRKNLNTILAEKVPRREEMIDIHYKLAL